MAQNFLVKLAGDGTTESPFSIDFPSYVIVATDPATKRAVVTIASGDVPESIHARASELVTIGGRDLHAVLLTSEDAAEWQTLIQERYQEGFSQWEATSVIP